MNPLGASRQNNLLRLDVSPAAAAKIERARANSEPLVLTLGGAEKKAQTAAENAGRTAQAGSVVFDSSMAFGASTASGEAGFTVSFDDIGRYSL
ncbi:MAG: hypothetical protein AB7I79_04520 [Rhizobiaceae bacterium]